MTMFRKAPRALQRAAFVLCAVCTASGSGLGCFEIAPPQDAGPGTGGKIAGRIVIADASGLSARASGAGIQARVDLTLAERRRGASAPVHAAVPAVVPTGRPGTPRDPTDDAVDDTPKVRKAPFEPSAALVLFQRHAYKRATLEAALPAWLERAGQPEVVGRVLRCSAQLFCKVRFAHRTSGDLDAAATEKLVQALIKARPDDVRVVSRNFVRHGLRTPNDPFFLNQWHYSAMHLPAAWDLQRGDPDLVIADIDSGVVLGNPDLTGRFAREGVGNDVVGMDLISHADVDGDDFPGRDTSPEDPGDELFGAGSSSFHGTHTSGILAAQTDNATGVAGVTWAGALLPVRVLGRQLAGYDDDILDGMLWAVGEVDIPDVPPNPRPARVLNLSLGGQTEEEAEQLWSAVVDYILDEPSYNNPIIVCAAGNEDQDAANVLPAKLSRLITVSATRLDGARASYANYGGPVDVMAPGGEPDIDQNRDGVPDLILSTFDDDYDFEYGTSMACPHVAGLAALLISQNPELTQPTVEALLTATANPASRCSEGCGAGLVDAVQAIVLSGGEVHLDPLLAVDEESVFIRDGLQTATVNVFNLGSGELNFTANVTGAQSPLFRVSPSAGTVAALDRTTLTITLTRGTFEAGSANITIASTGIDPVQKAVVNLRFDDNPVRTPSAIDAVEVTAYTKDENGNLDEVASEVTTRADEFVYLIKNLDPGNYLVFAVGDDNGDGVFDRQRESLGAYPTSLAPAEIPVEDGARTEGVNFSINPVFAVESVGTVGAPCNGDGDCTFAPDAQCITSFLNGYCTRDCEQDGSCGGGASCELLECTDADGNVVPCSVCLSDCVSDRQCRYDDAYVCDVFGTCTPDGL